MNKRFFNQQNLTRRLRLLPVLFAMLLMPIGAWAVDYNIVVGGVPVTSENAANIFDQDYATASYDNASNTLTLKGVHYDDQTSSFVSIGGSLESLTVHLVGYNEVGYDAEKLFSSTNACTVNITTDATVPGKLQYYGESSGMTDNNVTLNFGTSGLALDGTNIEATSGTSNICYFGTGVFNPGDPQDDYPYFVYSMSTIWYFSNAARTNENDYYPPTVNSSAGNVSRMKTSGSAIIKSLTFQYVPVSGGTINVALTSLDGGTTYATGTLANGLVTLTPTTPVSYDDVCLTFTSESAFSFVPMAIKTIEPESYGITVAGVQVTSDNASNITGDNITGTVSYDAENKILTLNNATIIPTTEDCGIAYTGTSDLTISLKGTNNFVKGNGGCSAIGYYGNEAPDLTFTKGDTNPCSLLLEAVGAKTASASTTIDGFGTVSHTGLYKIEETIPGDVNNTYKTTITSLGGGSGTAADPIIIKTADDLKNFSKLVNNGTINTAAMYFRLAPEGGTLDCSGLSESEYKPIGSGSQPFKGTFSGNGCTISNLIAYEGGLFGNISGATIEDLNLSNCTIAGNDYCIAGLATDASNGSTINLCTITNSTIECLSNQYDPTVGGIVARLSGNETTISNCVVNNTLIKAETTNGTSGIAGGIVGEVTSGKIENCHIKGESKITDYNNAGATLYAGAIVGKYDGEYTTLSGNDYYYDVKVETRKGTDAANKETKDGYTQRALGNGDSDVDGAVMYTKTLTLPAGVNSECNFYGPLSDNANGILALAPEQDVDIYLYPADGKIISAASLVYTLNGEQTVPLTNIGDVDQYRYSFKMPDVNATLNTTLVQDYDLWIGDTQVSDDNAANVLGDGKVSFTKSVGVDTGSTYTLTLNGVELTVPIKVGLANLTIDIQGTNTITTDGTCIQNVATTGTPSLTFKSTSAETGSLILTKGDDGRISDIGEGNITVSKELAVLLTVYGTEDYTSRLYCITDGSTTVAKIVPGYGVSMGKGGGHRIDIYAGNAGNVFGDGTVSFNNGTKTLTLNGASAGDLSTSLETLTVELVGNNTLTEDASYPVLRSLNGATVTINIQSTADVKGTLTMNRGTTAGNFNDGNVTVNITEPLAVISGSMINAKTVVIGVTCQLDVSFSASNEWATYYGSENLAKPEGLKAYQVTAVDGSTVTIGEIGYIPANTAVLLKNVSNNNTWSNIAASAYTGTTSTFASNKLIGTASDVDVSTITGGTVYILVNNMFRRSTSGSIPANRGYLVVEPSVVNAGNAPQLSISIGDENTTAISNTDFTDNTDKAGEWYSIDGVKLNGQPQKPGLYIKNGKKVFINKK